MRAIITVVAKDAVGIMAWVCTQLAERNVNVMDISQTLMQEYFTMIMLVDLTACTVSFEELRELMQTGGEGRGLSIRVQLEDIFNAMHRI